MEIINLKENCNELKVKFRQRYASIVEEDLDCSNGRKAEMLETLQQKLGKSSQELHEIITKL
jgi:hypothetical protein